jgi:hypothetical protein
MNRMAALFGVALAAIAVGTIGYQLGVSHGIAVGAQGAAAPDGPLPYGWYRPWGFGFGPFFPFLFFAFWFLMLRAFFWRGPWRRSGHPYGWDDGPARFDAWHRRAHERMKSEPPATGTRVDSPSEGL